MSKAPGSVLRLFQGDTRVATGRMLESGAILEVYPRTLKVFASEDSWIAHYPSSQISVTDPQKQEQIRLEKKQQVLEKQAVQRTKDQYDVESLYNQLKIPDTLTQKGTLARHYSPLQVKLGNAIHMLYFHRRTGQIGISGLETTISEFRLQPQYFYQSTRFGPSVQIV